MIAFDPEDPFPLLPSGSYTYRDAQEHSRVVDTWLGLDTDSLEKQISLRFESETSVGDQQLWLSLPVQTLQTPYVEIREMLSRLPLTEDSTLVDLGCGYARIGLVMAKHFPQSRFIGYEYVRERVESAQKLLINLQATNAVVSEADLSAKSFTPESADFYFIYDYGSRSAITKTLSDLRLVAQSRPIVVVGRGRASRDAIEQGEPWLSQVASPKHFPHYSIYFSSERD